VGERFLLEATIYEFPKSRKYPLGVRFGMFCKDMKTGHFVLIDNHYPKGPHVHMGDEELPYDYRSDEDLIKDFLQLILEQFGVKL